jgi:protein ImuA
MAALEGLRARVRAIEGGGVDFGREAAALGGPLDAALPWGGLPYRALHEVGGPAATSAVAAFARRFLDRGGALVWCRDARVAAELGEPYGPGLARFGLDPERVILARCGDEGEVLWSFEEALRCRGVACAVAEIGPRRLDLLASRRLQLAAEAGGGAGLALRPGSEPDPSPNAALTRWLAEPLAALDAAVPSWRLTLWRARGGSPGAWAVRWDGRALSFAPAAGTAGSAPAVHDAPERRIVLTG